MPARPYSDFLIPYAAVLTGLYLFQSAWIAVLLFHVLTLAVVVADGPTRAFRNLVNGWRNLPGLPLTLFGALAGTAIYILQPFLGTQGWANTLAQLGLSGTSLIVFLVYFSLVHAPIEELLWRANPPVDPRLIAPVDVIFAGYHALVLRLFLTWPWILLCLASLITASVLWRVCQRTYSGAAIPLASHAAADASIMLAVYLVL